MSRFAYALRAVAMGIVVQEFGGRLIVGPGVYVISPETLALGRDVSLNHFVYLDASGGVEIGSRVRVGNHSTIVSGNHDLESGVIRREPITIEDGAWIGAGVRVLAGIRVGEAATLGAGAVVTRDIPAGVTAVGVPARVVSRQIGD